jgi:hypothetical protein
VTLFRMPVPNKCGQCVAWSGCHRYFFHMQTHENHRYRRKNLTALLARLNMNGKRRILEIHNEQNSGWLLHLIGNDYL